MKGWKVEKCYTFPSPIFPSFYSREKLHFHCGYLRTRPLCSQVSTFHYTTVRVQPDAMKITTYSVGEYDPHRESLMDRVTIER
jgi:hypothetical protein